MRSALILIITVSVLWLCTCVWVTNTKPYHYKVDPELPAVGIIEEIPFKLRPSVEKEKHHDQK